MAYSDQLTIIIDAYENKMVRTLSEMIAIPAISPSSGGKGESMRADFLAKLLKGWGLETRRYSYNDDTGTERPSLIAKYGTEKRTIWIVAHIDTVAVGDRSLWNTDPFKAEVKDGKIYGRGTSDNGQSVVGTLYAFRALKESGAKLRYNFGIVLAADEEIGSKYGMAKLMSENIFAKDDMFLVPDFGSKDGSLIELGEKSLMWLKVTVKGKQAHASTPHLAKNAARYAAKFISAADEYLHSKYTNRNTLFEPDVSTFEPTKHEKNLDSVNIIPGTDVSYIDCRILPEYSPSDITAGLSALAKSKEFAEVEIAIEEFVKEESAKPTSENSEIVKLLEDKILKLRGIKARKVGIGGGTCALFPRRYGMQAAVWETEADVAHQPNEYSNIKDMVEDAKVFAELFV